MDESERKINGEIVKKIVLNRCKNEVKFNWYNVKGENITKPWSHFLISTSSPSSP